MKYVYGNWKMNNTLSDVQNFKKQFKKIKEKNIKITSGKIFSTDTFYAKEGTNEKLSRDGFLGVEMECSALYKNALDYKKNALCLCTVSDEIYSGKGATSRERQNNYSEMFIIALETATKL